MGQLKSLENDPAPDHFEGGGRSEILRSDLPSDSGIYCMSTINTPPVARLHECRAVMRDRS